MILNCDIHCHSGYSGGVGKISLDKLYENLSLKGINLYGSADILHPRWKEYLKESLFESEKGLFILSKYKDNINPFLPRIILQTEVIITAPYFFDNKKRKVAHLLILFPSFEIVEDFIKICEKIDVKLNIGRPFIKFSTLNELEDFFLRIIDKYEDIEFIPAHILTPDGVMGGENPIDSLRQFFGIFSDKINALESGLSADPDMILGIENLSNYLVISNSDAHSEALNRIGREFFALDIEELNYHSIINSIRNKKLAFSVEFMPSHGRYYLTGHRAIRHKDNKEIYFTADKVPQDLICPYCHKKMIAGVEYRVFKLSQKSNDNKRKQNFFYSIPLVDIISITLQSSIKSKKVEFTYRKIIEKIGFESNFYMLDKNNLVHLLDEMDIEKEVKNSLIKVKSNNFSFNPPGYDGEYGKLVIG